MSIYATLWEIKLPKRHRFDDEWISVFGQAVPAHIGHPSEYPDGDPYGEFLPPVVEDYDPEAEDFRRHRAVVIVLEGTEKEGQRYVDPLLTMSGAEYASATFDDLLVKIESAMPWDHSVMGMSIGPGGEKRLLRVGKFRE